MSPEQKLQRQLEQQQLQNSLHMALTRHVGRVRAVSMKTLYKAVFGEDATSQVNGTRELRRLVTHLRNQGVPVCSSSDGYWLAAAGQETEHYLARLRSQAIRKLKLVSKIRKVSLVEEARQLALRLEGGK